jgi:hypothetical protein
MGRGARLAIGPRGWSAWTTLMWRVSPSCLGGLLPGGLRPCSCKNLRVGSASRPKRPSPQPHHPTHTTSAPRPQPLTGAVAERRLPEALSLLRRLDKQLQRFAAAADRGDPAQQARLDGMREEVEARREQLAAIAEQAVLQARRRRWVSRPTRPPAPARCCVLLSTLLSCLCTSQGGCLRMRFRTKLRLFPSAPPARTCLLFAHSCSCSAPPPPPAAHCHLSRRSRGS